MKNCSNCKYNNVSRYVEPCLSCPDNITQQLIKKAEERSVMPDGYYEEEGFLGNGCEYFC